MRLIGKVGEFELYEAKPVSDEGWLNLRLVRTGDGKFPKRNWHLAWNGDRLARGKDALLLEEHYPEIHAAVIEAVQ
jgi:hypothetical protein